MQLLTNLAASLLLAALPLAQSVHVVDPAGGPGTDFTTLRDAIAAAQDGDLLLLRSGDHTVPKGITGKVVSMVADTGADVTVRSLGLHFHLTAIPTDGRMLLQGIRFEGLAITASHGSFWIEDCVLEPTTPAVSGEALAILSGSTCAVVLHESEVRGTDATGELGLVDADDGIRAEADCAPRIFVEGSTVIGGAGASGEGALPMDGGRGLSLHGGEVWIADSVVRGGDGANGGEDLFGCYPATDGGAGVSAFGAPVYVRQSDVSGGDGGAAGTGPSCAGAPEGAPGEAFDLGGGSSATAAAGGPTALSVSSPMRELSIMTVELVGTPGDLVAVGLATAPLPVLVPGGFVTGGLYAFPTLASTALGVVPASGVAALEVGLAYLPPGLEWSPLWMQAVTCGATCTLGPPAVLALIPESL